MSVLHTRDTRVAGVVVPAGTIANYDLDVESMLVSNGAATFVARRDLSGPAVSVERSVRGYRAVLYGDSMTDLYHFVVNPTASYDPVTGVLTVTDSGSHLLGSGWPVVLWSYQYASLYEARHLIATRVSSTVFSVTLPDRPRDLPTGFLSGTFFARYPHRRNLQSWVNVVQMLMGQPFDIVFNGAQSGITSARALAKVARACINYEPDVVFMQSPGINDMSTASGALADDTIWANLQILYESVLTTGAHLVLLNITPVASGEARGTLRNMERVTTLNERIRKWCRSARNVTHIDAWQLMVDPTSATGLALPGKFKTADNIHYNTPSAYAVGKIVKSAIEAHFPAQLNRRPRTRNECFSGSAVSVTNGSTSSAAGIATVTATSHGFKIGELVGHTGATGAATGLNGWWRVLSVPDANTYTVKIDDASTFSAAGSITAARHRNLFPNPVLNNAASGGTVTAPVTGTAAQHLNVQNFVGAPTVVASVVDDPAGYGKMQRLVCSAASDTNSWGFQNTSVTGLLVGQVKAGRVYRAGVVLKLSSANWANTPVAEIYGEVVIQMDSAYSINARMAQNYEAGVGMLAEDQTFYLETDDFLIPSGTVTQVYFQCWVRAAGTISANLTTDWTGISLEQVAPA